MNRFSVMVLLLLSGSITNNISGQNKPQEATAINRNVKEIIVVFKTHFDIGYTHRVKDVVQYYRTEMIDRALKAMDASKDLPEAEQFKWTCPGWVMSKVMEPWPGQTGERRKKLDEAFSQGKFITHALPFTIETDVCDPEVITRGLGFASKLTREYHLPLPIAAKVTDMPSHGRALATVLANAGVKFLHIGCNWPSGYVQTPGLFWWQGPDGSKLLTFYSSIYGTATGLSWPQEWGKGEHFVGRNLLPPADWPYKVWPAIFVTMDNSGPPKAEAVKALFDEARKKLPGVKIRVGTMDDFANALLVTHPVLPTVTGEMPDTWVHGVMCDPNGSKMRREAVPLLAADEVLNTQLKIWGLSAPTIADSVAKAYELLALYAEHTWGGAASINQYGDAFRKLPPSGYANLEASWNDKTGYVVDADAIANRVKQDNLQWLSQSVKAAPGTAIVYNPLPWKRDGMINISGQPIFVKNIPANGYTTVAIPGKSAATSAVKNFIENQFYKIVLDANKGAIISLIDKRTGHDWAANLSGCQTAQYLNERFTYEQAAKYTADYQQKRAWQVFGEKGDWLHPGMNKPGMISEKVVPYRKAAPANGKLTITNTAPQQTATLEMPADTANHLPASRLVVTLIKDQPYMDLEMTIIDKAKDNWPEADWLALPFNIKNPVFNVYRPLGTMNPATDILKGANKNMYAVGQGVTISNAAGAGIAVAPLDHPLISLDTMGCWKFSLDFVPKKPIVYINLYNNQWNTNYRYWYPGTWSSRVRIWTFDRHTAKDEVMAVPALEAQNPLQAIMPENSNGALPSVRNGLELSRKGIAVTAFGKNPDGKGTVLRLWEQAGSSGKVTVQLPKESGYRIAQLVNLRGEALNKQVAIRDNKIVVDVKAYAPVSIVLE